jgi:hypothetical protein
MAQDDTALEASPAELRVAFRETCARITESVNDVEAGIRTGLETVKPPRRTDSAGTISDLWRLAAVLRGSGVKPMLIAGAAAGYFAMRRWRGGVLGDGE